MCGNSIDFEKHEKWISFLAYVQSRVHAKSLCIDAVHFLVSSLLGRVQLLYRLLGLDGIGPHCLQLALVVLVRFPPEFLHRLGEVDLASRYDIEWGSGG